MSVAVDALAVYVNKGNPIQCITLEELNRIFSKTHRVSGGDSIDTWGQLGLTGEWANQPISMYGRNMILGTNELFREQVLYEGDFKDAVQQQPGSEAVVQKVANDKYGIGYTGIGYKTGAVRAVPLAVHYGLKCYDTSAENTYARRYPIARFLYIYVNKKPNQPVDPLRTEFIKYVLSKDGQIQTEKGGYYSINEEIRQNELKRLEVAMPSN